MSAIDCMTTMAPATEEIAVRQRLDMFKLGRTIPPALSIGAPGAPRAGHRHQRSHSRNASISSSSSFSLSSLASSRSSGLNDLSGFTFGGLSSSTSTTSSASGNAPLASPTSTSNSVPPPSKRNSHHRRRSSVSTRHESAEMMGVTLPDLPPTSDIGDKDSIRRRALWALEGKQDHSFNKVEIPELSTPDVEKMLFDFSSKSSLAGGASTGFGNSVMVSKRDSFKLLASSSSSKDQLHTLHEEEEEEEEEEPAAEKRPEDILPSPVSADEGDEASAWEEQSEATSPPSIPITKPTLGKPRPATLNLRPLSLVPDTTAVQGLPTPSLTPSPQTGLRSLSLSPASSTDESPSNAKQTRRDSVNFLTNPRRITFGARTTSLDSSTSSDDGSKPSRRSSISYKTSNGTSVNAAGLPTPEMTPTFGRRTSLSGSNPPDDDFFLGAQQQYSYKALSASEQHFLLKSHKTLVARITDLEKALSRRISIGGYASSSRPSSIISDATAISESGSSSSVPGDPSDEMLAFIRDLKAERDELKKDVEGWRTRVNDLDRKHALLAKRVETERWEAWAARSRVGILETEKVALEKKIEDLDKFFAALENDKAALQAENRVLQQQNDEKARRIEVLEEELERVRGELRKERESHQQQPSTIRSTSMDGDLLATPTPQTFLAQPPSAASAHFGLGLPDDQAGDAPTFAFTFNGVPGDDDEAYSDDDSGLAGYEDEYEDSLDASSSFGSSENFPGGAAHDDCSEDDEEDFVDSYVEDSPPLPARPQSPLRGGLSSSWSFPRGKPTQVTELQTEAAHQKHQSVDRFFNCLDESDATDDSAPASPLSFNYEQSKDMFARGFRFAAEDDAPFFFPPGVGTVVEEPGPEMEMKNDRLLLSVAEVLEQEDEDGDAEDSFDDDAALFGEEIGGIRITFTPPDDVDEPSEEPKQIQLASPTKPPSNPPVLPDLNFGLGDDEDNTFMFGLPPVTPDPSSSPPSPPSFVNQTSPKFEALPKSKVITPPTPPSSLPRSASPRFTSPSSIPRPIPRQSSHNFVDSPSPKPSAVPFPVYTSPPNKRSFIPQPVSSPSPTRTSNFVRAKTLISSPAFIRPPTRGPAAPVNSSQPNTGSANGSAFTPQTPLNQSSMMNSKMQWKNGLARTRK